ncbi:MAG: HAMP domain-containing histidine kinase [Microthrixaceae bacterium]|nr:HAMP domain-containing histidine kinase [Microthrixaceae bacterium]
MTSGDVSATARPGRTGRRFRAPMRLRTTIAFGIIAFGVSALVALVCFLVTRETLVRQRQEGAERQMFLNARAARSELRTEGALPLDALSRVQTSPDGVALLRIDGRWFASSVGFSGADVPADLMAVAARGSAGHQTVVRNGEPVVVVATPVVDIDAVYVELVPMSDVAGTLRRLRQSLALAVVGAASLGALAGWAASGRLLRPVRRMADAANAIGAGELDQRLEADGDADLEPLVDSFNLMVSELHDRIEREARFASDVSHELRSPLATMAAALSVTRRRVKDEAGLEALGMLEGEVERFNELVTDLLEISRAEAGVAEVNLEMVDPVDFTRRLLESTGRADLPLDADCDPDLRVALDKRRIGQVLTNLLANADNYAGGPTRVTVSDPPGEVRITVDDAGPGIPDHQRSYVFERFARGDDVDAPGTGLGLALVHEHVRLHGGAVNLDDAPGGGARFTIRLPRGEL